MKKIVIVSIYIVFQFLIGFFSDILLNYNISLPVDYIGIIYLVFWGYLNYLLYTNTESLMSHLLSVSIPVIILFWGYMPFIQHLIVNLPLLYIAPVFYLASFFVVRLHIPINAWIIILISTLLMVIVAYISVKIKSSTNIIPGSK